jgi:hypothetical protein
VLFIARVREGMECFSFCTSLGGDVALFILHEFGRGRRVVILRELRKGCSVAHSSRVKKGMWCRSFRIRV